MDIVIESAIQVAATAFAAIAAIMSYRQCKLMKDQLDGDRYLRQNEKSIELARLFAESIIPKSSYISSALKETKTARNIKDKIIHSEISEFTKEEFQNIVGCSPKEAEKKKIEELASDPAIKCLISARTNLSLSSPSDVYSISPLLFSDAIPPDNQESEKCGDKLADQKNATILACGEFSHIVNNTLNCLEYFCMAINSGVADDEVLYPSLHQVFFSTVESLYIFICKSNDGSAADRYYTHVTGLYTKWKTKHKEDIEFMRDVEREVREKYEKKKRDQLR